MKIRSENDTSVVEVFKDGKINITGKADITITTSGKGDITLDASGKTVNIKGQNTGFSHSMWQTPNIKDLG